MIALKIVDIKKMIHTLLASGSFDAFSLQEVSIIKDVSLFLEGRLNRDYFSSEDFASKDFASDSHLPRQEFALWSAYRPLVASFLGTEKEPLSFKFVLQASASYTEKLLSNPAFTADPSAVKALILTFRYDHGALTCLTGTAFHTFVPDKSLDTLWDSSIRKALANMQIDFEEL